MEISKSEARQLGQNAMELGAQVLRGVVTIGPEGASIDGRNVSEWLARHADLELVLIAAPVGKLTLKDELKSCYTCGRDYTEESCPHCLEVRARLRGEAKD